jgi:FkbM family methyltransferase
MKKIVNAVKNMLLNNSTFLMNAYDDYKTKELARDYIPTLIPTRILDLGAHKGIITSFFARRFPNAIIHSYEPNPTLHAVLRQNTKRFPNVVLFNEAVTTTTDGILFYISDRNVSSSILPLEEIAPTVVPSTTLQEAVNRIGGEVFVKMDIEGAEYDVLKHIPAQIKEIIGEAHPKKAGRSNDELRSLLSSHFTSVTIEEGKSLFRAV